MIELNAKVRGCMNQFFHTNRKVGGPILYKVGALKMHMPPRSLLFLITSGTKPRLLQEYNRIGELEEEEEEEEAE